MHEDIKHWSQYVLFSNQYLKYGDSRIERVQELFQAINTPINTVFATQLAKWFANTKAVLTSMPPIVANIMSLERHKGITCFEQTLDDHLYLSSHSTKTQTVLNENDFSVPEARDWSLRLQALSKSWIQDTRDVREIDSALELMEDVDCCWSPYEAYLCYGQAEYGHSKLWHTRLFNALKLRPITWSGSTLKEVVSSLTGDHLQKAFRQSGVGGGVPVTMFGAGMRGKSNAWTNINAMQAINRTMRKTLDLQSQQASLPPIIQGDVHFHSIEMTVDEVRGRMVSAGVFDDLSFRAKQKVKPTCVATKDDPKKFKHAPSVPGQNKDKPWLSGKRKNKL